MIRRLVAAASIALVLLQAEVVAAVAITGEGCRQEIQLDRRANEGISIDLVFRPLQRVVIAFVDIDGDGLYSEHVVRTSRDGAFRRIFRPSEIRAPAGPVAVVVLTSKSCDPGGGRGSIAITIGSPAATDVSSAAGGSGREVAPLLASIALLSALTAFRHRVCASKAVS
ncbi:MAG TPA: hypothetical protein VGQ47_04405 [Candidatus Limnocylindrales bacterium]|nr:hypothetical protein [Candidatus Limnocylindrales bacterium]